MLSITLLSLFAYVSNAANVYDQQYVNDFCAANAPLCASQDQSLYCQAGNSFWASYFHCDTNSNIILHYYDVNNGLMPTSIGALPYLGTLYIDSLASLTLPTQFGDLSTLSILTISLNAHPITSPIPTELGNLYALESFTVNSVTFVSNLPSEIGAGWKSIETFSFQEITYQGTEFPSAAIGPNWRDTITQFALRDASFITPQTLPAFGNAPNLNSYSVSESQGATLTFDDSYIFLSPQLTYFEISQNEAMNAPIGAYPYQSSSLTSLNLGGSGVQFAFDSRISNLQQTLNTLLLADSLNITGTIPDDIVAMSNLAELVILNTGIGGPLPIDGWDNMRTLSEFTIGSDQSPSSGLCDGVQVSFNGTLPQSLIDLLLNPYDNLINFAIIGTCITGLIPPGILSPGIELEYVNISSTLIYDPLPTWMIEFLGPANNSVECAFIDNRFCYRPKPLELSQVVCAFTLNGTTDACGVCEGNNSTCTDCTGTVFGSACEDLCGVCRGNDSCIDCAGIPNGTHIYDDHDVCRIESRDCTDNPTGSLIYDGCGVCGGDGTECRDCFGELFGTSTIDSCGVCGGANRTCIDCAGEVDGHKTIDACGQCVNIHARHYRPRCYDCMGVANGSAVEDVCGNCPPSMSCNPNYLIYLDGLRSGGSWLVWFLLGLCALALILIITALVLFCRRRRRLLLAATVIRT